MQREILPVCQYQGKYSHSTDECTTIKVLIEKAKSNRFKIYKKGREKRCPKHEVSILIEKKGKKLSILLKRWMLQNSWNLGKSLTTAMHVVKEMTAEAYAQT